MKKLNKIITRATKFKEWYDKKENRNYYSSNDPFYYDVLYELLIIQDGLCAYTERRIVYEDQLQIIRNGFVDGKYTGKIISTNLVHLEHFSSENKKTNGWNWENLFAAFIGINKTKYKLEKELGLNSILKPDREKYDPTKLLDYDKELHIFIPLPNSDDPDYEIIFNMILILGLNEDTIKEERKIFLNRIKNDEYLSGEKQAIHQFHTAYSMM